MNIKEKASEIKQKLFEGRSVQTRHGNFLLFIKSLKTKKITSQDREALSNIIQIESLDKDHAVNKFLVFLVEAWTDELFDIIVKAEPTANSKVEVDHSYDPEMLKIAGAHPQEWSTEDLKNDIEKGSTNE